MLEKLAWFLAAVIFGTAFGWCIRRAVYILSYDQMRGWIKALTKHIDNNETKEDSINGKRKG